MGETRRFVCNYSWLPSDRGWLRSGPRWPGLGWSADRIACSIRVVAASRLVHARGLLASRSVDEFFKRVFLRHFSFVERECIKNLRLISGLSAVSR